MLVHSLVSNPPSSGTSSAPLRPDAGDGRPGHHDRADRDRHGDRDRARRAPGGHAAVGEPAAVPRRAGSTSGSSAAPRCWSSCCSGTTSPRCYPQISIGIPFGPEFVSGDDQHADHPARSRRSSGSGLNEAAYMAEIVRGGILSVDHGQTEAAQALGMSGARDHAPDRPAAGDAGHHPAHRQRGHLHAEDHVAGQRHHGQPTCCTRSS